MLERTFIDSVDIYDTFGVIVTQGGYKGLVQYAPLKKTTSTSWPDEDGIEVDLDTPALDTKQFSITFGADSHNGTDPDWVGLVVMLSEGAYHRFEFTEIGLPPLMLRMTSQPNLEIIRSLQFFTLEFADDFPLRDYTYVAPQSNTTAPQGFEIDDIELSNYGVCVLKGSMDDILKSPPIKANLLTNINSSHGSIYDDEIVNFETKDVKLNCLMQANTLEEFWRNYNALLYNLVRAGERRLYVDQIGSEYPCYYKSCNVSEFDPTDRIWFKFSITLVFTSFRVNDNECILTGEDGEYIITEDSNYTIDLKQ